LTAPIVLALPTSDRLPQRGTAEQLPMRLRFACLVSLSVETSRSHEV
jgi:hypothetical protein